MYLKRTIDQHLKEWAEDSDHKPLLLRGARQIGKTTAVRHLAESFDSFIEINFEKNPSFGRIFAGEYNIDKIISELEAVIRKNIIPGKTLLFFDEIQACPRAISALRYFYEDKQFLKQQRFCRIFRHTPGLLSLHNRR